MTSETALWRGYSGKTYEYVVYGLNTTWNDIPGNYIFVRLVNGRWRPLYIGQTSSFQSRITTSHEKWPCAVEHGITHIHARTNDYGEEARLSEECDLINHYDPPCNK